MLYKLIIISYILLFAISCTGSPLSTKEKPDYGLGWNFIFWAIIKPEQDRQAKCAQPNAILTTIGGISTVGCINGKVLQGFIYDASTLQAVTLDTLSPGQSFLCKCNSETTTSFIWERGVVQENPPPGTITSKIFRSLDAGHTNTDALVYKTHYNQTDNLYCIPANCGFIEWKYQFLKIR